MPVWKRTIDLRPAVEIYKAHGGIPKTAQKAVELIEASGWLDRTNFPEHLRAALDELKKATTPGGYITAFDLVYDVADEDRVWIETT